MTISIPVTREMGAQRLRSTPRTSLDAIDLNILRHLERDGRMSKSELADRVNLSKSACHERVRVLERNKLILSYHAKIDVRKIVSHETFLTEVKLRSHRMYDFDRFERYVAKSEYVSECYAVGGGLDYILRIVSRDVVHYQEIMESILSDDVGIECYFTYVVTKVVKSNNSIPIETVVNRRGGI